MKDQSVLTFLVFISFLVFGYTISTTYYQSDNVIITSPITITADPIDEHATQLTVIPKVCGYLSEVTPDADWTVISSQIQAHILSDLDNHQLLKEWKKILSQEKSLPCRLPTLEISRVEQ